MATMIKQGSVKLVASQGCQQEMMNKDQRK